MGYVNQIKIDHDKCIGCGLCVRACLPELFSLNEEGKSVSKPVETLDWYGCIQCQHCMAVCPTGAISVLGLDPANSTPNPGTKGADYLDALVANRRSCRHYKQENVDPAMIEHLLELAFTAPCAGNKLRYEFTLIDDIDQMNKLRSLLRDGYKKLRAKGELPYSWDDNSLNIMEEREDQAMNGDMFFCSAPHLLIPHQPSFMKAAPVDITIVMTYFELLCAAHGLGTVYLGFPMNWMRMIPEVWDLLGIPEDHYTNAALGFGIPEFSYARGVQKPDVIKVNRPKFD